MILDVPQDHKLDGTMGENAGPYDTAEDVIERVLNDKSMMGGHGKHVIEPDPEEFISNVEPLNEEEKEMMCTRDLTNLQPLYTKVNKPKLRHAATPSKLIIQLTLTGFLYFLPTGLFYGWKDPTPYLPHESVKSVEIYEGADKEDIRPRNSCIRTLLPRWTTYRSPLQRPFEAGFGTCKKASNHRRSLPIFSLTLFLEIFT